MVCTRASSQARPAGHWVQHPGSGIPNRCHWCGCGAGTGHDGPPCMPCCDVLRWDLAWAEHVPLPRTWGKCLAIRLAIACKALLLASCTVSSRSGPLPDMAEAWDVWVFCRAKMEGARGQTVIVVIAASTRNRVCRCTVEGLPRAGACRHWRHCCNARAGPSLLQHSLKREISTRGPMQASHVMQTRLDALQLRLGASLLGTTKPGSRRVCHRLAKGRNRYVGSIKGDSFAVCPLDS